MRMAIRKHEAVNGAKMKQQILYHAEYSLMHVLKEYKNAKIGAYIAIHMIGN